MYIKILLSKPKHDNILSKIIRKVQGTPYSHVAIQFEDQETEQYMVSEAVSWGVRVINNYDWHILNEVVKEYSLNITKDQYVDMRIFQNVNAHKRYGFLQLIGIGISKLFGIKRNEFDDESRTYVCSEWVMRQLMLFGYKTDKDLDLVTPRDIEDLANKEFLKI